MIQSGSVYALDLIHEAGIRQRVVKMPAAGCGDIVTKFAIGDVPAYVVQDIFPADYEFREFGIRSGHSQTIVPVDKSVGQTHHIDVGVAEKFLRKGQ